jgi:hypothetical protein
VAEPAWPVEQLAAVGPLAITLPHDFRSVRVGEFMGRPAAFYLIRPRRVVVGYADASGVASTRVVTAMEIINATHQVYVSGHCHLREEKRSFRLDRIAFLMRAADGKQVLPQTEVLRWLLER